MNGYVLKSHDLIDMQMETMSLQPINEIPSAVISSLFKGLFMDDIQNEATLLRQDIMARILPRLQVEMLERHDGELMGDFERLLGSCYRDAPLHVIKFALYFSSNNMFTQSQVDDFLTWIVSNGHRTMSILKALLSYKLPTIEACVHAIFRRAIQVRNLPVTKVLLESGIDFSMVFKSSQPDLGAAIAAEDIEFIRLLIRAGAELNGSLLWKAVATGNTELVQLLLQAGVDVKKYLQDQEDDLLVKYPGALLQAAKTVEMAQLLLDSGVDVNALGCYYGDEDYVMTSLQAAIENGADIKLVRMLIRAGANVNAPVYGRYGATALMMAVRNQDIEAVKELLESGAQTNIYCEDLADDNSGASLTELQEAASFGLYEIVEALLDAGADPSMPGSGEEGTTALQRAAEGNYSEVVWLLLKAGAEVNAPSNARVEYPRSSLLAAVENGNIALVRVLLDAGADVNAPAFGNYGFNALEAALACREEENDDDRYSEILRMLMKGGADIKLSANNSHRGFEFHKAVSRADIKTIQFLLSMGVDVNISPEPSGVGTVLRDAVEAGNSNLVELLLREGADVNSQAQYGAQYESTALQEAVWQCDIELVRRLLKESANVDAPGGSKGSALEIAIGQGDITIVQLLLQAGAEVNMTGGVYARDCRGACRWTPLHRASVLKNKGSACKIVKLMLSKRPFLNVPPAFNEGQTILQAAIESSKTIDDCSVARILIEAGENVNAPVGHKYGRTALQLAVAGANLEIVQFLLSEGADINAPAGQIYGRTALQLAVEAATKTSVFAMVDFLLEQGADVDGLPGYEHGRSALQIAASAPNANIELIERLLKAGASVNLPAGTLRGLTALQGAMIQGHAKVALILLKAGANVNGARAKQHGRTAFEGAAEHGRLDMVQILLNAGADSHLSPRSRYVRSAELAESNSHFTISKILRDYHARGLQTEEA